MGRPPVVGCMVRIGCLVFVVGRVYLLGHEETGEISDNRQVIETGYLQLMLKGGIIYDVVVILFMLTAVVSGFKQHNGTIYYITVILMTYFIDLYTTNPVCLFSVRSILFWFCISILLNCKNQKRKKSYSLTL